MEDIMKRFQVFLIEEEKSELTVKNYLSHLKHFLKWFDESKGIQFSKLFRENVLEYISFLRNIEKVKKGKNIGKPLSIKTINAKISFLINFNNFLKQEIGNEVVVTKKDLLPSQSDYFSVAKIDEKDVERFRQIILENHNSKRNYTIVTLLAYCGLRISEALNLKVNDVSIEASIVYVRKGKRDKFRKVFLNDKVIQALRGWFKERKEKGIESEYLFTSKRGNRLDKTVINRMFNDYSEELKKDITPHDLRHFFCTYLFENDFGIHEVKAMAGHSNIHTTMIYTNPSEDKMKEKMKNL